MRIKRVPHRCDLQRENDHVTSNRKLPYRRKKSVVQSSMDLSKKVLLSSSSTTTITPTTTTTTTIMTPTISSIPVQEPHYYTLPYNLLNSTKALHMRGVQPQNSATSSSSSSSSALASISLNLPNNMAYMSTVSIPSTIGTVQSSVHHSQKQTMPTALSENRLQLKSLVPVRRPSKHPLVATLPSRIQSQSTTIYDSPLPPLHYITKLSDKVSSTDSNMDKSVRFYSRSIQILNNNFLFTDTSKRYLYFFGIYQALLNMIIKRGLSNTNYIMQIVIEGLLKYLGCDDTFTVYRYHTANNKYENNTLIISRYKHFYIHENDYVFSYENIISFFAHKLNISHCTHSDVYYTQFLYKDQNIIELNGGCIFLVFHKSYLHYYTFLTEHIKDYICKYNMFTVKHINLYVSNNVRYYTHNLGMCDDTNYWVFVVVKPMRYVIATQTLNFCIMHEIRL